MLMILLHDDSTFLDMSRFSNMCLTTELGAFRFPVMVGHYVPLSHLRGRTMEEFM